MGTLEWILFSWAILWIVHIIVLATWRPRGERLNKLTLLAYVLCAVPITWVYIWLVASPMIRRHMEKVQ